MLHECVLSLGSPFVGNNDKLSYGVPYHASCPLISTELYVFFFDWPIS